MRSPANDKIEVIGKQWRIEIKAVRRRLLDVTGPILAAALCGCSATPIHYQAAFDREFAVCARGEVGI